MPTFTETSVLQYLEIFPALNVIDQLNMFIAAGLEARLSALEAA